ncbi:MAG: hypothetical protein DMF72_00840 [Acidobacteria bacterium]|nr:MAG: hypothetical protein DMF72_00840 [Acidobacteriota bacterium]
MKLFAFGILILAIVIGTSTHGRHVDAALPSDKMTVEDIIAKHLESLGPNVRATKGARVISGSTQVTFKARGTQTSDGVAVLASDGLKSMVTMKFPSTQYPYEKIGYDGSKVTSYQLRPGDYSSLGSFVRTNPEMFKEGLLGGTLSTSWPLLDLANRKAKLEVAGTKKSGGRELIEVRYRPAGGSDLRISLFFDAETFQHVRTTYKKEIAAQMGRGGSTSRGPGGVSAAPSASTGSGRESVGENSARQSNTIYELTEEFSDFKAEEGVTLPHSYKIRLEQIGASTQISEWTLTLAKFIFNQHLEVSDFDVSGE